MRRDDEWFPEDSPIAAVLLVAGFALVMFVMLLWCHDRDQAGMAEVETVATTVDVPPVGAGDRGESTAPEIVDRGWPADWPTRHQIGLHIWAHHLAEVEASSMAIERQADGQIVVTNPPEAPIAHHGVEPEGGWTVWDRVAACESGDKHIVGSANWHINSGNGYSGGLQWLPDTWRRAGGHEYTPHAWQATREQQIAVAEAWLARTSWGQWPGCARFLGLIP